MEIPPSLARLLADGVLAFHVAFVLFVTLGGLLVLRFRRLAWVHLPCAVWGALIELAGWICPLTPLENHLRGLAGQSGYAEGFLEHYLLPVLYPQDLTRAVQVGLGLLVVGINAAVYLGILRASAKRREEAAGSNRA